MGRSPVKTVALNNHNLELIVDGMLWKSTLRAAISMGYLPRYARNMTSFSASFAYGLAICAEETLTLSKLGRSTDGNSPDKRNEVLALIGFCKAGPFSISGGDEGKFARTKPINSRLH